MSPAVMPIAVGSIVSTVEDLDALPVLAAIIADPSGRQEQEKQRHIVLQKRADGDSKPSWYAARGIAKDDLAASEEDSAVHGAHYGPFLVLWLPLAEPVVEAAA